MQRRRPRGGADQKLAFPLIARSGTNAGGRKIRYYFNYSGDAAAFAYPHGAGIELLSGSAVASGQELNLAPWGLLIIRE